MSWDINHVVIIGRLTKDPELTYTQSGAAVCRFSIAVNRSSGSSRPGGNDGSGQDDGTSFFNIVTWNKTAEICKEYLSKGRQVGIDGRLQQRRWNADDGTKRSIVEIVANNVQFFGSGRQAQDGYASAPRPAAGQQAQGDMKPQNESFGAGDVRNEADGQDPFLSELDDDEIPF
ncbi:MAG TPA: single-stranded DNA-binding protein [Spirochaetota bacterium]|nr:single-stranded DNA-binding protein [Spirochaetota bacterium]